ncbi:hypothetical protein Clacol_007414 [Clathrus columnatus]|uniref:50S ribosomal protein L10 n=1 Tax=Clathrus columnatus TaxID=1419009 RepID=A0AAV5AJ59_9AGAM|nr:hypothetical protein Clacol_007414 [Clathrus columnatus]
MLPLPGITGKVKVKHLQQFRSYVVSITPSKVYPKKKIPREYSVRKTFLFDQYSRLLDTDMPLLLLTHKNFSTQELIKLRRTIASIKPVSKPPSLELSPAPSPTVPDVPQLIIVRTGLIGVALREKLDLDKKAKRAFARVASPGALAILSLPSLHPPQLASLLRVLGRAVPPKKPPLTPEEQQAAAAEARLAILENPTPGRRKKRVRPTLTPELEIKGALIEKKLFLREELQDISKLPSLDTLRGQLLGLLSMPAVQIATVLSQAAGGQLARTLEGFKKGLEMAQEE